MMDTFFRRAIGAAMLDAATYEEVEADRRALPQAIALIVLSSVAAGVGARGMSGGRETFAFVVSASIIALLAWAIWAVLMFQIGARLMPQASTQVTIGELLRTLGFAAAPGVIQVFGMFPGAMVPVFVVAALWTLAASVIAVKQALDYTDTTRAVLVCTLGWTLSLALALVLGLLFSPPVA